MLLSAVHLHNTHPDKPSGSMHHSRPRDIGLSLHQSARLSLTRKEEIQKGNHKGNNIYAGLKSKRAQSDIDIRKETEIHLAKGAD